MKREHFVKVVEGALDSLPEEFRSRIKNVAIRRRDLPRALPRAPPCQLTSAPCPHVRIDPAKHYEASEEKVFGRSNLLRATAGGAEAIDSVIGPMSGNALVATNAPIVGDIATGVKRRASHGNRASPVKGQPEGSGLKGGSCRGRWCSWL